MNAIDKLLSAIGYPAGEVSPGVVSCTISVDGGDVRLRIDGQRLVLEKALCRPEDGDGTLERLAGYAAGRILREEAVLAWDPQGGELILWQDVPAASPGDLLRRVFEVFMASCDWWLARVADDAGGASHLPEMVIMP